MSKETIETRYFSKKSREDLEAHIDIGNKVNKIVADLLEPLVYPQIDKESKDAAEDRRWRPGQTPDAGKLGFLVAYSSGFEDGLQRFKTVIGQFEADRLEAENEIKRREEKAAKEQKK